MPSGHCEQEEAPADVPKVSARELSEKVPFVQGEHTRDVPLPTARYPESHVQVSAPPPSERELEGHGVLHVFVLLSRKAPPSQRTAGVQLEVEDWTQLSEDPDPTAAKPHLHLHDDDPASEKEFAGHA